MKLKNIKKKAWGNLYDRYEWSIITNRLYLSRYLCLENEIDDILKTDTVENLNIAAASEMCFYIDIVEPHFFTKYSDIKYLDEYLNNEPIKHRNHINLNKSNNYYLAIIVAYINKNPNLNKLVKTYRNFLNTDKEISNIYIEKFEKLVNYIMK